ncbi:MAG: hypothetical protein LR008_01190 [Candidatus Pacebacteria bacterium]|nr:hypothetical protein [Candidatus Paceibacterota bacterium]
MIAIEDEVIRTVIIIVIVEMIITEGIITIVGIPIGIIVPGTIAVK